MKKIKESSFNSYEEMRLFSKFRQNILCWYEFKNESKILHLGSECGILTNYLIQFGKVICVEESEQYNNLNKMMNPEITCYTDYSEFMKYNYQKFDYVVIEGFLDKIENKKIILEELLNLLNKNGEIIILTNNKLGLKYFNGYCDELTKKMFGNLTTSNKLYTYKQWVNILKELNREYVIFYPFPNMEFPISIYSDKVIDSHFPLFYEPSEKNKIDLFDEREAFEEIKKSGYFKDFCNSFFIVINSKNCYYLYSKISSERNEEFQICTNILSINGENLVYKKALHQQGIEHLKRVNEYYFDFTDKVKKETFYYCPSNFVNGKLLFEYIEGKNLEQIISEDVKNNNINGIISHIKIILNILTIDKDEDFHSSELLKKVFGDLDYSIFTGEKCQPVNNIDLIFENVIFNEDYSVIDYEWILKCCIPKKFIIFRAIFHSQCLSKLKEEEIKKIYNYFEISEKMLEIFLKMENNFQKYVTSQTIFSQAQASNSYSIPFKNNQNRIISIKLSQNNSETKEFNFVDKSEIELKYNLNPSLENINIKIEKKSIIKINKIEFDGIPYENLYSNADFIINNDYYFLNPPVFNLKNNKFSTLKINITFYYYGVDAIDNIIALIETNKSLDDQIKELKKNKVAKFFEKIKR